jgi:hypothetical protein
VNHPRADATTGRRLAVAVVFALAGGIYITARVTHEPAWTTDFDQLWHAARALLAGQDPYDAVGPGRAFQWDWPLYYPLPAVLFAVPFTVLDIEGARIAFSTLAGGALGWAIAPRIDTHWPILLSASFLISISRNQWAPLLLAAAWAPALGIFTPAKPTVGVASLANLRGWDLFRALAWCGIAVVACFVVEPGWLANWREAISTAPHIQSAILTLPAGPLLSLAVLRYRRPETWAFLALVLIPHTPSLYDLLLLFLVCRTFRDTLVLSVLTQALFWGIVLFGSFNTFDLYAAGLGQAAVFVVYLPALAAILRRPNRRDEETAGSITHQLRLLPENWIDTVLLSLLLVAATLMIWLPLVTYR